MTIYLCQRFLYEGYCLRSLMPSQMRNSPPKSIMTVRKVSLVPSVPMHTNDTPAKIPTAPAIMRITPNIVRNSCMIKAIVSLIERLSIPIDYRGRISAWAMSEVNLYGDCFSLLYPQAIFYMVYWVALLLSLCIGILIRNGMSW